MYFFLSFQRQPFRLYFTSLQLVFSARVAAVKRFSVHHHDVDYIFISFGIIKPVLVTLKIEHRYMECACVVGAVGVGAGAEESVCMLAKYIAAYKENKTESQIFFHLCSLFPKATF